MNNILSLRCPKERALHHTPSRSDVPAGENAAFLLIFSAFSAISAVNLSYTLFTFIEQSPAKKQ
jgi:hypothetical protein